MSVEQKVKQIIVEQLGVDEAQVDPTASFVDDLGADSLDIVELVMAFEEAFDLDIPDEDAEKIATVKDAVTYIESKRSSRIGVSGSSLAAQSGCHRSWNADFGRNRYGAGLASHQKRAERHRPHHRLRRFPIQLPDRR